MFSSPGFATVALLAPRRSATAADPELSEELVRLSGDPAGEVVVASNDPTVVGVVVVVHVVPVVRCSRGVFVVLAGVVVPVLEAQGSQVVSSEHQSKVLLFDHEVLVAEVIQQSEAVVVGPVTKDQGRLEWSVGLGPL